MIKVWVVFIFLLTVKILNGQVTWIQKTSFAGTPRYGAVSFSIGTKAYLGTGNDSTSRNDFWEWDQTANSWTPKAAFPGAERYLAVGFSIGNKGYIGTGASGTSFPFTPHYSDFWEYNPATDQWTQIASFQGTARFGAVGFSIGNKGYVGTGFDALTYFLNDFWEYDPALNQWIQKTGFPGTSRMHAVGFSIGSKGYVGTGGNYIGTIQLFDDFWEYDPAFDQWMQKAYFVGNGRTTAIGFSAGGKGYIGLGGDFISAIYPDFWEYNPVNDQWVQGANFGGISRWLPTGFSIGNKGYIATGGNFAPTYNDLWEFIPAPAVINELDNQTSIKIFPDPADKIIKITIDTLLSSKARIVFWNASGVVEKNELLNQNLNIINVSSVRTGAYFYQISDHQNILKQDRLTILH